MYDLSCPIGIFIFISTSCFAVAHLQLGRPENKPVSPRSSRLKLFVTDGTEAALTGQCVFFLRTNVEKPITAENIHRVSKSVLLLA